MNRRIVLILLAAAILAGAAILAVLDPILNGSPSVPTTPAGDASPEMVTITPEQNGTTLELAVGQRFLLKLGDEQDWKVAVSDPRIISRVAGVLVVRGAQGIYQAEAAGKTTLNATAPGGTFRLFLVVR